MYTIIPLLLAHIQELNNQILFLFKFIVKNIPLNLEKSKDDSLFSPKYNKLKVDKLPLIKVPEKKDYKQLLNQYLKEYESIYIFYFRNIIRTSNCIVLFLEQRRKND